MQTATVADLAGPVAGVSDVPDEPDSEVARLKSELRMVEAIGAAVRFYEQPPEQSMLVQTEWVDLRLTRADWSEAFSSVEDGTPHNEAHSQIRETLVEILLDKARSGDSRSALLRAELLADPELHRALHRSWPMIEPTDLVGDLWTVPAYLRLCAPELTLEQVRLLQRPDPAAWTSADLPLLDAARHRLGDADRARRRQRQRAERAAELERRRTVIDEVIAADDDPESAAPMLRHADLQGALLDASAEDGPITAGSRLAGPFAHLIVDEAQELTDAQWRMLLRRCPSGSLTVVGDRAQSRRQFDESWPERLERIGLVPDRIATVHLSINYRTPSEVMDAAAPVIRAVRPDANVPESVRSSGVPVEYGRVDDLERIVDSWLVSHSEGVACVIAGRDAASSSGIAPPFGTALPSGDALPAFSDPGRVRVLTPAEAKGLEFDLVVLVDPESFGTGVTGAVDRYVAMTRATQSLVILTSAR